MSKFTPAFDYVRGLVSSGKLPSAVFGVADKSGKLDLAAFGKWPGGRDVQTDDVYLLWSVTKPIVGLASMQLWERGAINLQEDVRQRLPWFGAGRTDKVTLWHLFTHTAGISESTLSPATDKRAYLAGAGVSFHAGTYKQYSNQAFVAQELIVEAVTGKSLEAHLQENVFGPLAMHDTSFDTYARDPAGFVPMVGTDKVAVDIERFLQLKHPAAGLYSTAPDLLALGQCLLNSGAYGNGRILHRHTLAEMTRPQTTGIRSLIPDDWTNEIEFGLTWKLPARSRSIIYRAAYGHDGWGGCQFWVYPQDGVCFVLLTNLMDPNLHGVDMNTVHNVFGSCL
jgi:CubicO group peptidase (beta-lactamase class C family)